MIYISVALNPFNKNDDPEDERRVRQTRKIKSEALQSSDCRPLNESDL